MSFTTSTTLTTNITTTVTRLSVFLHFRLRLLQTLRPHPPPV